MRAIPVHFRQFLIAAIELRTLPSESEPIPESVSWSTLLGARKLPDDGVVTHLPENSIMVGGDGTLTKMSLSST
jgi:hypothetical protein